MAARVQLREITSDEGNRLLNTATLHDTPLAVEVRPLRFTDLRHTFGSLLAERWVDVITIKKTMGHSALSTTSRYLHARPAAEQAQAFTAAFRQEPRSPS